MKKRFVSIVVLLFALLLLAACGGQTAEPTPEPESSAQDVEPAAPAPETAPVTNAVSVENQVLGAGGSVTIPSVTADTPGWLVIHAQADGKPGPVLGHAAVAAGENKDVVVEIDSAAATGTVYAMLHVDAGTVGTYEFPGDDVPALGANGSVVTPPFELTMPAALLSGSEQLGQFLVGANGMTLYMFTKDGPGESTCYDGCAQAWPPLLLEDGQTPVAGDGVFGNLGVAEREDGGRQVTYNGFPLYYWASDTKPGDTTGNGVNDVWFVVDPAIAEAMARTDLMLSSSEELGDFLVGANGMTLYLFTKDEPGVSNCSGGCAQAWPPLLVAEGNTPTIADGITGEVGTTVRDDATIQVTYNGHPLYYWASDVEPGDTTGHGVNDVWFVVDPEVAMAMPSADLQLGESDALGQFLVQG